MVGTYLLTNIFWSGNALDINGDGIGSWELLDEFSQMIGSSEFTYISSIQNSLAEKKSMMDTN